jgi:hypothetical protein
MTELVKAWALLHLSTCISVNQTRELLYHRWRRDGACPAWLEMNTDPVTPERGEDSFEKKLALAKEPLQAILAARGITRVVCVDDQYGQDRADSLELIRGIEKARRTERRLPGLILELFDLNPDDKGTTIEQKVDARWSDLKAEQRQEAMAELAKVIDDQRGSLALTTLEVLARLVDGLEFVPLPESGWRERQAELSAPEALATTLFLFDRSLGGAELNDKGLDLANEFVASHRDALCGILTATLAPGEELGFWNDLPNKDHMVVISKSRLGDDPISIVPAVRRTLLNPWRTALLERLDLVVKEADSDALKQLKELDIHSFEHLVFNTSVREGIWEPDTLLRLHALRSRRYARMKAREDPEIIKAVKEVRALRIKHELYQGSERTAARSVMREEWYEEGEHLNGLHLPLDLGDIFRVQRGEGEPQLFMLMGQACDLMVRGNGKRPNDLTEVDMLRLEPERSNTNRADRLRLEYWGELEPDFDLFVRLRPVYRFSLDVLDLCTFDARGRAVFGKERNIDPDRIPLSWLERLKALDKLLQGGLDRFRLVTLHAEKGGADKAGLQSIASGQVPILCGNKPDLCRAIVGEGNSLSYQLARVARLSLPRASDILAQFAAYNARGAFEHDMAQFEPEV